jgi:tRNA-modifying protein YgfZ
MQMREDWRAFLGDRGAELDDGVIASFGNPDRELRAVTAGEVIADLSHVGIIRAHGEDANTFLQGQLTNDIRQLDETSSQLSAYCNPKGRMLALFRIFRRTDSYYLCLPRALLEATLKRLRMYVLRSRVTLDDVSDRFIHIGLSGPRAENELQTLLESPPARPGEVVSTAALSVLRVQGPHPRFEIFGDDLQAMTKVWTALDVRGAPVGALPWALLDVRAGVPAVYPETVEAFVPQMVNLHALGGISFNKGCYTGQEIVARMHYLGTLKRRMFRARINEDAAVKPGDAVHAPGTADSVGAVVTSVPSPDGGRELLAVIQLESMQGRALRLFADSGPLLHLLGLPYAVEVSREGS